MKGRIARRDFATPAVYTLAVLLFFALGFGERGRSYYKKNKKKKKKTGKMKLRTVVSFFFIKRIEGESEFDRHDVNIHA